MYLFLIGAFSALSKLVDRLENFLVNAYYCNI